MRPAQRADDDLPPARAHSQRACLSQRKRPRTIGTCVQVILSADVATRLRPQALSPVSAGWVVDEAMTLAVHLGWQRMCLGNGIVAVPYVPSTEAAVELQAGAPPWTSRAAHAPSVALPWASRAETVPLVAP